MFDYSCIYLFYTISNLIFVSNFAYNINIVICLLYKKNNFPY